MLSFSEPSIPGLEDTVRTETSIHVQGIQHVPQLTAQCEELLTETSHLHNCVKSSEPCSQKGLHHIVTGTATWGSRGCPHTHTPLDGMHTDRAHGRTRTQVADFIHDVCYPKSLSSNIF